MRAIKFRAWDLDNFQMHYSDNPEDCCGDAPDIWQIDIEGKIYFMEYTMFDRERGGEHVQEFDYHTPNQVLMQYTGLKDKSGRDIYEGDRLKQHFLHNIESGIVEYVAPEWKLRSEQSGVYFNLASIYCEVIGNIYDKENP